MDASVSLSFRKTTLPVAAAGTVLCIALSLFAGYGMVDDAYISLRYADNLAKGHGLVFNPGERVEGYTNPLWTWLLAVGLLFTSDGSVLAVCLSLAAASLVLFSAFRLHTEHFLNGANAWWAVSTPLAVVLYAPFLCYAASGLETPFFTLLLIISTHLFLSGWGSRRRLLASAVVLAAATLTRPEASVCFVFNLCFLGVMFLRKRLDVRIRHIAEYAFFYGVIVGLFLLWRFHYYGDWRPNTYHAKIGAFNISLLVRGAVYVAQFPMSSFLFVLLPAAFLLSSMRSRLEMVYCTGFALALLGAVALEGGDHLALFRFCVPAIPFSAILLREALVYWFGRLRFFAAAPHRRFLFPCVGAVTILLAGYSSLYTGGMTLRHGMSEHRRALYEVRLAEDWAEFGRYLRDHSAPGDSIALLPIGAVGYYSGLRVIDMAGLTDLHIARLDIGTGAGYIGHEKFDNRYILEKRPRFLMAHHIAVFRNPPDEAAYKATAYFRAHRELVHLPALQELYVYRTASSPSGRWFAFYERR